MKRIYLVLIACTLMLASAQPPAAPDPYKDLKFRLIRPLSWRAALSPLVRDQNVPAIVLK